MGDPSIEERIARIVRAEYDKHPASRYPTEHAVAAAVVAELLTQEWGSRSPEGWGPWSIYHGKSDAEGSARRSDVLHSRFVTGWERAE